MRTQATQTDIRLVGGNRSTRDSSPPSYLSLSPRLSHRVNRNGYTKKDVFEIHEMGRIKLPEKSSN